MACSGGLLNVVTENWYTIKGNTVCMVDYECPECGYEAKKKESVAGHALTVHSQNLFASIDEINKESTLESMAENLVGFNL